MPKRLREPNSSTTMAAPPLLTTPTTSIPLLPSKPSLTTDAPRSTTRRELTISIATGILTSSAAAVVLLSPAVPPAMAEDDDEYVRETKEVIDKVRSAINMPKTDPKVVETVAELRDASNYWVAKYRKEKSLLGRPSFREVYSALNAVSGHYISFGLTTPIPAKRKTRILEEMDTAEKALLRGR